LHVACASRWHRLDPARAGGLTEVARLLLAAGADPAARPDGEGRQWSPLLCAVAGAPNPAITGLLLEHGARPDDHVLYLAAFESDHECLRLLLPYAPDIAATTALSAPISTGNVAGVRLLLDAGADPNHLLDATLLGESHEQSPPVRRCPRRSNASGAGTDRLLLEYGAAPDVPGPDGRTPTRGRPHRAGPGRGPARAPRRQHDASSADEFLAPAAALTARAATRSSPPATWPPGSCRGSPALTDAADHGHTEAVRPMLDLGFPPGTRSEQDNGATALHLAAAAGSTGTVRLLLDRGADIEARDTAWNSTPLEWAIVGSGMRLGHDPDPDWPATVSTLLDAGASADGIVLAPDDPKPPSPESRRRPLRGIPDEKPSTAGGPRGCGNAGGQFGSA
jgi:ankyrin repeat protein